MLQSGLLHLDFCLVVICVSFLITSSVAALGIADVFDMCSVICCCPITLNFIICAGFHCDPTSLAKPTKVPTDSWRAAKAKNANRKWTMVVRNFEDVYDLFKNITACGGEWSHETKKYQVDEIVLVRISSMARIPLCCCWMCHDKVYHPLFVHLPGQPACCQHPGDQGTALDDKGQSFAGQDNLELSGSPPAPRQPQTEVTF